MTPRALTAEVRIEPLDVRTTVKSAVRIFAGQRCPAILETSQPDRFSRYTILACDPVCMQEMGVDDHDLEGLLARLASVPRVNAGHAAVPFPGGWIGFLGYEPGALREGVGRRGTADGPLARFGLYDTAVLHDPLLDRWWAVAVDWPTGFAPDRARASQRMGRVAGMLQQAKWSEPLDVPPCPATSELRASLDRDEYYDRFSTIKAYIAAGDIYQVNLTIRFSAQTDARPLDLYERLRAASPSPYGAFLDWGDLAVVSASPELFLSLNGRQVVTRPIKGTRPRGSDPLLDAGNRRDLAESEKERAELNMIVDLLRNDLGRVSEFGSVRVARDGDIEAHGRVFHRIATIEAKLRGGATWEDLMLAAFPCGSITGAPKIRAMQIIAELEPVPRGVYCGAIGWIGLDGSLALSVAIRTIVQRGRTVHLHAGGGIVADSICEPEHQEIMAKLESMRQTLYSHELRYTPCPLTEARV